MQDCRLLDPDNRHRGPLKLQLLCTPANSARLGLYLDEAGLKALFGRQKREAPAELEVLG